MKQSHEDVLKKHLHGRENLLTDDEKAFVQGIEQALDSFHERYHELMEQKLAADETKARLAEENEIVANLPEYIKNNIFFSMTEGANDYKQEVIRKLEELREKVTKTEVSLFLKQLLDECSKVQEQRYELEEKFTEIIDAILDDYPSDALINQERMDEIYNEDIMQTDIIIDIDTRINALKAEAQDYKEQSGYNFDYDNELRLAKISRKNNPLTYSVLYAGSRTNPEDRQSYALFLGKEQILGKGKNGLFKLCQNLQTNDWAAVKILPEENYLDSEFETEVLDEVGRLYGVNSRNNKQYIVQELLHGQELAKYINEDKEPNLEARVNIARQAIALVAEFNTQFLHRDIKPENFIWDANSQTLYLCDFGYSCRLDYEAYDEAGSPDFLAPEIINRQPYAVIPYSCKTETYALGHTLQVLFADLENVPEEINEIISEMTADDPERRFSGNYSELLARLDDIDLQYGSLSKPT